MRLKKIIKSNLSNNSFLWLKYIKHKYKTINFRKYINQDVVFPIGSNNFVKNKPLFDCKSVIIFSCYSVNSCISDVQLYYLKKLSKCADAIIVIFDNPIFNNELNKLEPINNIIYMSFKHHGLYDFGSYKIGLLYLANNDLLKQLDYLILCNDSCYGPLFDLRNIVKKMNKQNSDFWGMVTGNDFKDHLQSWFICFKKNVILNKTFTKFFYKVKYQKYIWDIILKYEIMLTTKLVKKGFKYDSFIPKNPTIYKYGNKKKIYGNLTIYPMELIYDFNFPFIKKKCFTEYKLLNDETSEIMSFLRLKYPKMYDLIFEDLKQYNKI